MAEIIKAFTMPYCKYNSSQALKVKRYVFDLCFYLQERKNYAKVHDREQEVLRARLMKGAVESMVDMSVMFSTHTDLISLYPTLSSAEKKRWMDNLRKGLESINEPVDNIIHFVVPMIFQYSKTEMALDVMLVMAEVYDTIDMVIQALMVAYDNHLDKKNEEVVVKTRDHLRKHCKEHFSVVLNPLTSPFRLNVGEIKNTSTLLDFFNSLDVMTDDDTFSEYINTVVNERKGIDMYRLDDTNVMQTLFVDYLNNGSVKEIHKFVVCLFEDYVGEDRTFVIRNNTRWFRKLKPELQPETVIKIDNVVKLFNISY